MDITDGTAKRIELGIERLLALEDSLVYDRVVLCMPRKGALTVSSFSKHTRIEAATREEAEQAIAHSEQVFERLKSLSTRFKLAIEGIQPKYEFCFDHGTSAVSLATSENGKITWVGK